MCFSEEYLRRTGYNVLNASDRIPRGKVDLSIFYLKTEHGPLVMYFWALMV